jgi:hypothetical protein
LQFENVLAGVAMRADKEKRESFIEDGAVTIVKFRERRDPRLRQ